MRVLDPATREAYQATQTELAAFGRHPHESVTLYRPRGDLVGKNAGYRGRTGIYELIAIDEPVHALIHAGASEAALEAQVRPHTPSLASDGWARCVAGVTSVEEVLRVTREE